MPTLLHVDSSPLGERSISRRLSGEFVDCWRRNHRDGEVIRRDLSIAPPVAITAEWIGASFVPEASRSPAQQEVLHLSDSLIAELESADEYVIGAPMHNFGVPSVLKLWIDQIVRTGKTFGYADGIRTGLLKDKRATFIAASGGVYEPGTEAASLNFVEPYLRAIFGFMGVTDVHFIAAGGVAAVNFGKMDREAFLEPHLAAIHGQFAAGSAA